MATLFKRRKKDGVLVCKVPDHIVELLQQVVRELQEVIVTSPSSEVTDRLFPRAYLDPTEETAEQEWQSLVHDDLVAAKIAALTAMLADLDAATPASRGRAEILLDAEGETRWLTVLNDARLTLGTVLGVNEDGDLEFPDDDPRSAGAQVYAVLTTIQGDLVEALLDEMPEQGTAGEPF